MLTCSSCCVTVTGTRGSPTLGHLTNFCTNFYDFFNLGKFVKIREFFFAEVTNSRSMFLIKQATLYNWTKCRVIVNSISIDHTSMHVRLLSIHLYVNVQHWLLSTYQLHVPVCKSAIINNTLLNRIYKQMQDDTSIHIVHYAPCTIIT